MDTITKPFFNIQLKRDEKGSKFFILNMTDEVKDLMGEPPLCQNCNGMLSLPFYICEEGHRWYCKNCQTKTGDVMIDSKEIVYCKLEPREGINEENHMHICIKKVVQNG